MPGHTVSRSTYYVVSLVLAMLLVVTVAAAYVDAGPWNVLIALAIATSKAALIMLFFMHLKYSPPLVRLVAIGSLVWLGILFVIMMSDYVARGWWG